MQRRALGLEEIRIERNGGIVDDGEFSLRRKRVDDLREVVRGMRETCYVVHGRDTDAPQFFRDRLAMIDHLVRASGADPLDALRPGRACNHLHTGQLACKLHQDRADPARRADHQQRLSL
jgi:hypothetical protein